MRQNRSSMKLTIFIIPMLVLPSMADEMWVEIAPALSRSNVMVRVMDPQFRSDLYWIDRSNDGGRTWTSYRPVINGEWIIASWIPQASFFRARLTIP